MSKIKHILSVIHYTICGAVCFQFTHFLCDDWDNIYTLSYYHHQIGCINYYPLFRVRSWNNGMRCMSFYILTKHSNRPVLDRPYSSTDYTWHCFIDISFIVWRRLENMSLYTRRGLVYQETSLLKSMLVNKYFQTWHLIGWQHSR